MAPTGFYVSQYSATKLPPRSNRSNTVSQDLRFQKVPVLFELSLINEHTSRSTGVPHGEAGQPGGGAGGRRVALQTNRTAAGIHTILDFGFLFLGQSAK